MRIFGGLGRLTYRYRWPLVVIWAAIVIAGAFFAPHLADRLKGGGFNGANTEAEQVGSILENKFDFSSATLTIVFKGGKNADARGKKFQSKERQALESVSGMRQTSFVTTYASSGEGRLISKDGTDSYALVGFNSSANQTQNLVQEVRHKVEKGSGSGLKTYVTGAPAVYLDIQDASNQDIRQAEAYAFPIALVILVLAFGSIIAAGVPVLVGGASVVTTLATLYFLSGTYDMSIFSLSIATMLGLGLGIDYALFAVSRFREELEEHEPAEAVHRTVATAGRSIFFSGTAVLIGLSGLLFFPFMFIRSIGVAGVTVVFVAVAAALTLLPAILGILGRKVNALPIRRRRSFEAAEAGFWGRAAEAVMRRPVVVILVVGVLLTALLYPVGHMKVGVPEASVLPKSYESRAGDNILKQEFDYAALNPIQVLAKTPGDPLSAKSLSATRDLSKSVGDLGDIASVNSVYSVGKQGAREYAKQVSKARTDAEKRASSKVDEEVRKKLDEVKSRLGTVPPGTEEKIRKEANSRAQKQIDQSVPQLPKGISSDGGRTKVTPQGVANFLDTKQAKDSKKIQEALDTYVAGDRVLIQAVTKSSPYEKKARGTVANVRGLTPPAGTSVMVGGLSAGQKDFIGSLYGTAPYALAFVLGVTFLVLFLTFRSVFIPLKAVIVNMLSLTASFGAVVWVFQDGHLSGLLDFTPLGFVDSTLPILMFCTIFGVSMDYEVFLLSRIREAYEDGEPNSVSVRKGLVSTAGIITSAAAILVVVTGAFAFAEIIITKAVGLGLAVAVLVDATIIRIMLVPALMRILGDWNWWPGGRKKVFHGGKYDSGK